MPPQLFFVNVPYDCSDREFREWIESSGIQTESIRVIRDLVAGVSPSFAYAALKDPSKLNEAVNTLNGKKIRHETVQVSQTSARHCAA